jgi:hypothetical protein
MSTRTVLTLATGKPVYFQMAINLARSFVWWHKDSDIRFCLLTDMPTELPEDLSCVDVVRVAPGTLGKGFSAKLHLNKMVPAETILFVDADCLIVRNLEPVFERFAGRAVSVVGGSISEGEWFGDVAAVCRRFNVLALPKFNGGIYYLERGAVADAVYQGARELETQYDEIGLVRLRGLSNDELLMAISMALHGMQTVPDDGTIMGDFQACPELVSLDVLSGKACLSNPPAPCEKHREWYPVGKITPAVIHFLGDSTSRWPYRSEEMKLQLVMLSHWPVLLAKGYVTGTYSIWQNLAEILKDWLRPLYHACFGARAVAKSPRI